MTESHRTWTSKLSPLPRPAFAVGVICLWLLLEFTFRRGFGPFLADQLGSGLGAAGLILTVGFPLIAGIIAWLGLHVNILPNDWEYTLSLRAFGAGIGGYVGFRVIFGVLAVVYMSVLGLDPAIDASMFGVEDAPIWALLVFFVGNGIIVPISEELAWRGVIQTALTDSYGTYVAVSITAIAFVLKHLVVDLSAPLFRVSSLILLAFLFGILRAKYGTASSTIAHLSANTLSTGVLLFG